MREDESEAICDAIEQSPTSEQNKSLAQTQGWPRLDIVRGKRGGLVDRIVEAISKLLESRELRVGTRMPSVRQFAKCNGISTFTVVEAYERLATLGLLSSRRGSGYYVARTNCAEAATHPPLGNPGLPNALDALAPDLYSGNTEGLAAGCGWLPPDWIGADILQDAVKQSMRIPTPRLRGYGHTLGFPGLRQSLAQQMSEELVEVDAEQILITHGATHAFDLILRTLTKPGDEVLVEDPGYSNLHALIRHHGCIPLAVPRGMNGLALETLETLVQTHQPRLMFVNTVLQNPLGTSLSHAQTHRLLALAEQHDFWIVEDDIYRDLAPRTDPSLAALDGLRRVIRVSSCSKTLSPMLRVGSIAASASLIPELVRIKMLTGLTTSEINERAVYHAISGRPYRRMLSRLISQLDDARARSMQSLLECGLTPLAIPRGGLFISAGWKRAPDSLCNGRTIAESALKSGILLSPGDFFSLNSSDSIWFRFNVAYADDSALKAFLREHTPQCSS